MDSIWSFLVQFIDNNKLAGWVRAGVAALFGALSGWAGGKLAPFLTPELQTAVGVVVTTIVVGLWQQLVKTQTALLSAAATANPTAKIVITNQALANSLPSNVKGPEEARVVTVGPAGNKT